MPTPAVLGRSTRKTLAAALVAVPLGLVSAPKLASGQSFTLIQPAPGFPYSRAASVTNDGMVAGKNDVISSAGDTPIPSFTWTPTGGRVDFVPPNSYEGGYPILTSDGRYMTVTGKYREYTSSGNYLVGAYAYRRNPDGSYTSLPGLTPDTYHQPSGISGDGHRIVGYSGVQGRNNSWVWDHGVTSLLTIPGTPDYYTATGISRDGSTIVGNRGASYTFGFVRQADGTYQTLQGLTPGKQTVANGVNADGSIIVGGDLSAPLIWKNLAPSRMDLPSGFTRGYATGVSDDGGLIVGVASGSATRPIQDFVWTQATGSLLLGDYARTLGIDLPSSWNFGNVALSGNGQYICGTAFALDGTLAKTAFRLQIPAPSTIGILVVFVAFSCRKR